MAYEAEGNKIMIESNEGIKIAEDLLSLNTISEIREKIDLIQKDLSADILSDMDENDFRLIHGDLYRENVRITESGNNISGIIDWKTNFRTFFRFDAPQI